jgi:hypothetical protein
LGRSIRGIGAGSDGGSHLRADVGVRVVVDAPPTPARRHESSVDEPAKVATRSCRRNVGLAAVARSVSTADQRLLERDDETIWPATARNEVPEERPPHTGFLDLPKTLARLNEVSLDAERDPLFDSS